MKTMRKVAPQFKHGPEEREGLLEMLSWLKGRYPLKKWTLVEIGTYLGESAAIFSRYFKKVITCDPWVIPFMQTYAEGERVDSFMLAEKLKRNLEGCRNVKFYRYPGSILATMIPDKSVDMVYIDAWHRVIPCSFDIATWTSKIRPGGVMSGHDYRTFDYTETIPAVRYLLGEPQKIFPDSSWLYIIPNERIKL